MEESRQPHIAMLIGALTRGGSERVMVNLAEYLADQGWKVTLVTQYRREEEYPISDRIQRVISDISPGETGKSRILNFIKRFRKLRNIWKIQKPDLILSFIGKNNLMALITSRFLPVSVAVSVRADPNMEYSGRFMRLAARGLFRLADGVILQTSRCFAFFPEAVRKKAVLLKNPISQDFFREPFTGQRKKEITAVGRVDENKNHELLIRAFAEIAELYPEHELVIYGEGELRPKLTELVDRLGLKHQIRLPGAVENVADAIYETGVFVLSSNTEGVPNTLIEAMILGVPVIATDCPCGGPADLIEHGVNGLLTGVDNLPEMKENLQNLLDNLQLSMALGEQALKTRDIYLPERVYGEWKSYLSRLMRL